MRSPAFAAVIATLLMGCHENTPTQSDDELLGSGPVFDMEDWGDEDDYPDRRFGRMTGGGSIEGADGVTYTIALTVHCAGTHLANVLQVTSDDEFLELFHLEDVDWVVCIIDPDIPVGDQAGYNTVVGVGSGRTTFGPAGIWFKFVDAGEPGKGRDLAAFEIIADGWMVAESGVLLGGNLEALLPLPN